MPVLIGFLVAIAALLLYAVNKERTARCREIYNRNVEIRALTNAITDKCNVILRLEADYKAQGSRYNSRGDVLIELEGDRNKIKAELESTKTQLANQIRTNVQIQASYAGQLQNYRDLLKSAEARTKVAQADMEEVDSNAKQAFDELLNAHNLLAESFNKLELRVHAIQRKIAK